MNLAADMITDLDQFFGTDEFGKVALYNGVTNINVNFNNPDIVADNIEAQTTEYLAECKTSDVPGIDEGFTFVIETVTYYVTQWEKSIDGLTTRVVLSEIDPTG